MIERERILFSVLMAASLGAAANAQESEIGGEKLERILELVQPGPKEALWARVPWLLRVDEARRRAVAEDKPLFIWRAGGGDVLGRA